MDTTSEDIIVAALEKANLSDSDLELITEFIADLTEEQLEHFVFLLDEDAAWLQPFLTNLAHKVQAVEEDNQVLWQEIVDKEDLALKRIEMRGV